MIKVVYNKCYGGFGLSDEAMEMYKDRSNLKGDICQYEMKRHDEVLVEVVEELGERSWGMCAKLRIEEVNGVYRIEEYDGYETVMTSYPTDWINPCI